MINTERATVPMRCVPGLHSLPSTVRTLMSIQGEDLLGRGHFKCNLQNPYRRSVVQYVEIPRRESFLWSWADMIF